MYWVVSFVLDAEEEANVFSIKATQEGFEAIAVAGYDLIPGPDVLT